MQIGDDADTYRELYSELEDYEKKGVSIMMNGSKKSPLQVVTAHIIKEEGSYMRDYVADEEGRIESLMFVHIDEK